jgi:hypothetical protein
MAANHNITLWAIPRFHRPERQFTPNNRSELVDAGSAALDDVSRFDPGVLKAVAEGISESPDGAACIYTCDVWRQTVYSSSAVTHGSRYHQ